MKNLLIILLVISTVNLQAQKKYVKVVGAASQAYVDNSKTVKKTVAQMRLITNPKEGAIYQTTDYGGGFWNLDLNDDSTFDNTGLFLRTADGKLLRRIVQNQYVVNVQWFGATGIAGADNTTAINNAIAYCNSVRNTIFPADLHNTPYVTLYFPHAIDGSYKVTSALNLIKNNINVIMDGLIVYNNPSNNETVMTIGQTGRVNLKLKLIIKIRNANLSDWQNSSCVGVKIVNAQSSDINIEEVYGFTKGALFVGDNTNDGSGVVGSGFVHNKVYLAEIVNNKYGVYGLCAGTAGYLTENTFHNGHFGYQGMSSQKWDTIPRYGFFMDGASGQIINNNLFIKPSFELSQNTLLPYGTESACFLMNNAVNNKVVQARVEGVLSLNIKGTNPYTFAREYNGAGNNDYDIGFNDNHAIINNDSSTNKLSYIRTQWDHAQYPYQKPVFNSGNLAKKIVPYDGTTYNVAGVDAWYGFASHNYIGQSSVIPYSDYISVTGDNGFSIMVNTSKVRRFLLNRECKIDTPSTTTGHAAGRFMVVPYDSTGAVFSDGGTNTYVRSGTYTVMTWSSGLHSYFMAADRYFESIFIWLDPRVYSIKVIWYASTPVSMISFGIDQLDPGTVSTWTTVKEPIPNVNVATTAPGSTDPAGNTWQTGYMVMSAIHTANTPSGWRWNGAAWIPFAYNGTPAMANNNLSDLTNAGTARGNLGFNGTGKPVFSGTTISSFDNTSYMPVSGGTFSGSVRINNAAQSVPDGTGAAATPQLANTQTSGVAASSVGVTDGIQNNRMATFVDYTNSLQGFSFSYSGTIFPVVFRTPVAEWARFGTGGNFSLGTTTNTSLLNVGSGFQVNSSGDIVKLNGATTSFPSSNSTGFLYNSGSGVYTINNTVIKSTDTASMLSGYQTGINTNTTNIALKANIASPIFTTNATSPLFTNTINSIGTSTTEGVLLNNTTAAAVGAQQNSPAIHLKSFGWGTTAGTSQEQGWWIFSLPVQGTTPTSELRLQSGGTSPSVNALILSSAGAGTFAGGLLTPLTYNSTKSALATTRGDAFIAANLTAATSGVPVQISSSYRSSGQAWDGSASRTVDFDWSTIPVSGTSPVTGYWKLASQINAGGYTEVLRVGSDGKMTFQTTVTAAGTTGAQTINKASGQVNFAAGASTLVVTNSLVTTSSQVMVTVYGTDATATSARVTKASGSFTITLNATATAETAVGFWVIN